MDSRFVDLQNTEERATLMRFIGSIRVRGIQVNEIRVRNVRVKVNRDMPPQG